MAISLRLLLLFVALHLTNANGNTLEIEGDSSTFLLRHGDSFELLCKAKTMEENTVLNWTYPFKIPSTDRFDSHDERTFSLTNRLKISKINASYSGTYICNHWSKDGMLLNKASRVLKVVTETKENYVFTAGNKTASLACSIDLQNIKNVKWLQNKTFISDWKDKSKFKEENNTLTILTPEIKDAGLYIARFTVLDEKEQNYDCEVYFMAAPTVEPFDKPKNLIQGDNMEIQCKVQGYPYAVVTWYKDNKQLNISEGNIEVKALNEYQNAILRIKEVDYSDAGEYECSAYSDYFSANSSKSITVRVKDKLAALWPFLGIVGEVVILCTIIFIYEKRRNKRAEQEEINAQEVDDATSDKKEGLRHRNTASNNSSA